MPSNLAKCTQYNPNKGPQETFPITSHITYPYLSLSWEPTGWFGCAASCVGQAGRDGRDGRDGLAVLRRAWDRLVGTVRDGRDGLAVLRRAWDRLVGMVGIVLLCSIMCGTGWSGRSGWCGYGCARGNLAKLESDPTVPISTARFRFCHSDFDNTPCKLATIRVLFHHLQVPKLCFFAPMSFGFWETPWFLWKFYRKSSRLTFFFASVISGWETVSSTRDVWTYQKILSVDM